jgi:hypothetical protein
VAGPASIPVRPEKRIGSTGPIRLSHRLCTGESQNCADFLSRAKGSRAPFLFVETGSGAEATTVRADTTVPRPEVGPLSDIVDRVLTVERAGAILGLSRASAYRAAHRWLETDGAEGLPVLVISRRRLVVPVAALQRLLETARALAS